MNSIKILITGFQPFGDVKVNPSERLAKHLAAQKIDGAEIRSIILPVTLDCRKIVENALKSEKFNAVIHFGVAAKREQITPELVAINCLDFDIPDNDGKVFHDEKIEKRGPAAYFATLPNRAIAEALKCAGFASLVSTTAGTYLCNYLMYSTLHLLGKKRRKIPAGFIHLPPLEKLPEEKLFDAGKLILQEIARKIQ
ncbi:MAG: peptidase C15 [Candidatus Thermoplasmatota archaeon]|nr:peptidase C15 [Candidatus Thermoplasmatota archaeon]